jgi:hypothetical protein
MSVIVYKLFFFPEELAIVEKIICCQKLADASRSGSKGLANVVEISRLAVSRLENV